MALHCVQMSLFSRTYTILGNKLSGTPRRVLAGSILIQFAVFTAATTMALLAVVTCQALAGIYTDLIPILAVLAIGMPFILLRDHARQFCFAQLNVRLAVVVDSLTTVIQIAMLAWLAWHGHLSAASAIGATAIATGVAGITWLWLDRHALSIQLAQVLNDFRRQWVIGQWDCASEMVFTAQIHGLTWFLAFMLDRRSVGIYSACTMAIMVLNPLLLGINSLLVPSTARRYAERGLCGLRSLVNQSTIVLGTTTALFSGIAALWGPTALEFLYRGQGFDIPAIVVALLSLGVVVEVLGIGPENALWAMERHDFNFRVELVGGLATLVSATTLIPLWGLTGAATSFLVGRLGTTLAHWVAYHRVTRELQICTPASHS